MTKYHNIDYIIVFYSRYKLRGNFPGPIISEKYKANFLVDTHVLEVAVKADG